MKKVICIIPESKKDHLASTIIEGLYRNQIEIVANSTSNGSGKAYSVPEIIEQSQTADHVFIIWGKEDKPSEKDVVELVNSLYCEDVSYIDGSEWNCHGQAKLDQKTKSIQDPSNRRQTPWLNKTMLNISDRYFKRECYPDDAKKGIIPLLFAARDEHFYRDKHNKDIDLFCGFGHTITGLRKEVKLICEKFRGEGYNVVIESNVEHKKFFELTARSVISVDAWGAGDCNMRLFEIIANKSCCLYQRYSIETGPNWFEDGTHAMSYSTIEQFELKLRLLLKNRYKALEMAESGYNHLMHYHTSEARVQQMLEIIDQ